MDIMKSKYLNLFPNRKFIHNYLMHCSKVTSPENVCFQVFNMLRFIRTLAICCVLSNFKYTGLFISPSGTSELDCATTKKDTAERSISIGRESLKVFFFVLGALAYLQVPPLGGSRNEKWRAQ